MSAVIAGASAASGFSGLMNQLRKFYGRLKGKRLFAVPVLAVAMVLLVLFVKPYQPPSLNKMVTNLVKEKEKSSNGFIVTGAQKNAFSFYNGLAREKAVFRIGVLLSGLEIALRNGDGVNAIVHLEPLITLLNSLENGERVGQMYSSLLKQVRVGDFKSTASQFEPNIKSVLTEETIFFLKFGEWAQAAKLAAVEKNIGFFDLESVKYYRQKVYQNREIIPPGVGVSLDKILTTRQNETTKDKDLLVIEDSINEIIAILI